MPALQRMGNQTGEFEALSIAPSPAAQGDIRMGTIGWNNRADIETVVLYKELPPAWIGEDGV